MQNQDNPDQNLNIDNNQAIEGKQVWETPSIHEAFIGEITESIGLGNNDGAASHS